MTDEIDYNPQPAEESKARAPTLYVKTPLPVEAIRYIGLTPEGDPYFDIQANGGIIPEWIIEAMSEPEGGEGSLWVDHGGEERVLRFESVAVQPGSWLVHDAFRIILWGDEAFGHIYTKTSPDNPGTIMGVGMDAERWAARIMTVHGDKVVKDVDWLGWFSNAIMNGYDAGRQQGWTEDAPYGHPRPNVCGPADPVLDKLDADGRAALVAALDETDVEHPSDLPNGSVERLREASSFVIGEGFKPIGDSDGDDGA